MDRKKVDSEQHRRPLFDGLNQHKKKEKVSFHVPGHKNGPRPRPPPTRPRPTAWTCAPPAPPGAPLRARRSRRPGGRSARCRPRTAWSRAGIRRGP